MGFKAASSYVSKQIVQRIVQSSPRVKPSSAPDDDDDETACPKAGACAVELSEAGACAAESSAPDDDDTACSEAGACALLLEAGVRIDCECNLTRESTPWRELDPRGVDLLEACLKGESGSWGDSMPRRLRGELDSRGVDIAIARCA